MAGIGDALGLPFAVERPDGEVGKHAHRGVEEGDVDVAAYARPLGVEETDHEPDHARIAAREVDDAHAALAGWSVGLAGDPHVARVALDQVVEAGLARPGPGGPEAAEGAADDARIHVLELGVGEPEPGGQIAPHVVEDGVGDLHEIVENGAARRVLEIEGERLLAAIERLEVERVLLVQVGRHVAGAVAAHRGILDLDHLGAQVGEDLRAEGAGSELGDGEDADAVERGPGHVSTVAGLRRGWGDSSWARGPFSYRSTPARPADCPRWSRRSRCPGHPASTPAARARGSAHTGCRR